MNSELILSDLTEKEDLYARRAELFDLEPVLQRREADLATLRSDVLTFEHRYLKTVGQLYDELGEIEKQIAAAQGLLPDDDDDDEENFSFADDEVGCGQNRLHSDKLKKLYREVARRFHPDLATDEQDRCHRHQLMVEVNRAYSTGAEDRLQSLLEAGVSLTDASEFRSTELAFVTRKLAEVKERLAAIDQENIELTTSEIYKLKVRIENAEAMGIDLFTDLIAQVERQIKKARNRLFHLQLIFPPAEMQVAEN